MIDCATDCDSYIEFLDSLEKSIGTEQCDECRKLIHVGTEHYKYFQWTYDEYGEEITQKVGVCCEECGDLVISFLELGFCWDIGAVRADIAEMNCL